MPNGKIKFYISSSAIVLLATLIIAPVLVFAWTDPTTDPPGPPNVPAPINVGSTAQTKQGDFRIDRSGTGERVGIGTSNPSNSLTLDYDTGWSDLYVDGGGTFKDSVILDFVPSDALHATNKNYVDGVVSAVSHWDDNGNDIYNTNTGNVGIGTANPSIKLHINATEGATSLQLDGGNEKYLDAGNWGTGATAGGYLRLWDADTVASIVLDGRTDATNRHVYFNNGGNVGIGTTGPLDKLEIYNSSGSTFSMRGASAADQYFRMTENIIHSNNQGSYLRLEGNGNKFHIGTVHGSDNGGADRPIMTFTYGGTGNVGIGTTEPGGRLTITTNLGSVADENILELREGANPAYGWYWTLDDLVDGDLKLWRKDPGASEVINFARGTGYVTFSDNVGIGGTPNYKLDVKDSAGTASVFGVNDTTGRATFSNTTLGSELYLTGKSGTSYNYTIDNKTGNYLKILSARASAVGTYFDSLGNVGIGTADPEANLEVIGSVNIGDFATNNVGNLQVKGDGADYGITVWNEGVVTYRMWIDEANDTGHLTRGTSATAGLSIETNGNVGIGTADPHVTLHVEGDAKITGELELGGSDVAEEFVTNRDYLAGTVLVMGDNGYKSARACDMEYDTRVIGVVSDNASLIMGKVDSEFREVVAMVGVVKVKVNNSNGQIYKGDLLTTSKFSGQAMKAVDPRIGTIIGKALENLWTREGEIMALVNLQ